MSQNVTNNPGEIYVTFNTPTSGKVSFRELGIENESVELKGGFLRLVFDLEGIGEHEYFAVPTIQIAYAENMSETHWICEFNGQTILDKMDHHGHSSVLLMDRKKLSEMEHHHKNTLIIHAEFPEIAHLDLDESYINIFK